MSDKPRLRHQELFYIVLFNVFLITVLFVAYLLGHPLPAATAIAGSNFVIAIVLLARRWRRVIGIWRASRRKD